MLTLLNLDRLTYTVLFALLLGSVGCQADHSHDDEAAHVESTVAQDDHAHDDPGGEHAEDGHIQLTRQQREAVSLEFGQLSQMKVESFIKTTGVLDLPPGSQAVVSASASGFLRQAKEYVEGDYVKKGTLLAQLENPDFIDLQQRYLEVGAELEFLRTELTRQKDLAAANAGIARELERAESQIHMKQATQAGLRAQLQFLGIRPDAITPSHIVQRIDVRAPRSGYLATISIREGLFVTSSQMLAELIDDKHFHLELAVFEADVAQLKVGQRITYTVPSLGDARYRAEVHVIGKEFDRESKTVRVHGHIEGAHPPFIRDLFAEAKIWLDTSSTTAIAEAAVVRNGTQDYLYVSVDDPNGEIMEFEAVPVVVGRRDEGLAEIKLLAPLPEGARVVTKGAYYVYAQSKVGEMAHEH